LKAPEYRNVEREFKVEMIKYETTKMGVEDLKKFQKALDMALLQYHSSKLGKSFARRGFNILVLSTYFSHLFVSSAEVNKIVRELWMMTYKGQDIQSIEIVSGQEPGSKAQKSYNYRVVMTKGSTEIDMRGRCSAGQRVLASIVIRLALAESFGINCGCIALDEPTVNLDFDNKKGMSTEIFSRAHFIT
jgi:DNA repair protein RAD50